MAAPSKVKVPQPTPAVRSDGGELYRHLLDVARAMEQLAVLCAADWNSGSAVVDVAAVRRELEVAGRYPLSIDGLRGRGADPQTVTLLLSQSSATRPRPEAYAKLTFLVEKTGSAYKWFYRSDTSPPTWVELPVNAPSNMAVTNGPNTFTSAQTFSAGISSDGVVLLGPNGATVTYDNIAEEITLSTIGLATDSVATLIPDFSIIRGVVVYVTQTISGGGVATVQVGDATTPTRFGTLGTLTITSGMLMLNHHQGSVATNAAGPVEFGGQKLRLTATGGTPTQGKLRVVVWYERYTIPTS
jgi:hypothetical protein